ncbi:transposase [Aeromicrobium stalagmiti]|uniref:transposase n=1 Tax=Aeromicrobium stalagmiti TaxID=2738988 RepID=UPI00156A268F|nr:transposase [Aeromicrobium stalagmiti]
MPAAEPEEFRRRAVELAGSGDKPVAEIAKDLGISESCLRRWMAQTELAHGVVLRLDADRAARPPRMGDQG